MASVLKADRKGMTVERRPLKTAPEFVGMHETLFSSSPTERVLVTGEWWIFSLVFPAGPTELGGQVMPGAFAMLVPPRSLLRLRFQGRIVAPGMGGKLALPERLRRVPSIAEVPRRTALPSSLRELIALMADARFLDPDEGATAVARRGRALLLDARDARAPVGSAAKKLRVTPDGLTRMFKRAYGIAPKEYVHRARVADAVLQLMSGADMLRTVGDAGFQEVSRFYEQFGKVTRNKPGDYARMGRKTGRSKRRASRTD